ncbi:hypothetical protein VOLCADRAFT_94705 [Volvox carteri f. nagariensis]|uniref:DNA mismatch repair protein S5 domain-containing protein n=1 Tax=Volvox carteri f. nagariensis TaxID=3068 RepID=D8U5I5_VOLCA|nr:uncharacterized protein VOLCADRAFT_94705 [Volvox carteri f. nagariensis]EFJ45006.1 hypothetical protein VOLCADRAFT_94705 [Volvox carteri f. nagariensis]|eukprot:XP_002953977.1 hypothetical protein VOLCADRAFT_94705 [Volvox carteri f. nagariensis]
METSSAAWPFPVAPPVIRKLDENVVNKIAAGEVIQRPASALKEMLENSLDAGATQISVLVKEGGNKLLQITDNGCGVRKEDLPILCHRHTTSKLREYEDLETISTLGFRGEALCSISFVSHMTVTTMARGAQYGYRVTYKDSEMEPPGPRPVASVPGTTITVEDLFYNVPTRRKALKSANEEYGLILDVVGRYAVYSTGVAFSCRRQGDSRPDISTTATGSRVDAVRSVYGVEVARELLSLKVAVGSGTGPDVPVDGPMGLSVEGLISGANYSTGKKTVLVLFINGRCVECSPLRRALEGLYGALLPKASRPWIFLDVRLPPRQVEVNMHPTKREVGFMHQAEVIEAIRQAVEAKLLASNESRTFATSATLQTQLPFASLPLTQRQSLPAPGRSILVEGGDGELTGELGGEGDADGEGVDDVEEGGPTGEKEEQEGGGGSGRKQLRGKAAAAQTPGTRVQQGSGGLDLKRPPSGTEPLPYRPEKLVRVDYRSGTLDTFVISKTAADGGAAFVDAARAVAAGGSVARKRSAAARLAPGAGNPLGGLLADASSGEAQQQQHPESQLRPARAAPPALVTAEVLGVGPFVGGDQGGGRPQDGDPPAAGRVPPRRAPPPLVTADPAVLELWSEVESEAHSGLGELLREHTFVGMADGSLALLQHGTRLYLVDVGTLSRDMFYQLALRRWEQPLKLDLEPPPLVSELVALGLRILEVKGEWQPEDGSPEELGELVTELLRQNGPALEMQLGLVVDQQGSHCCGYLLRFLSRPMPQVQALADLYAARPPLLAEAATGSGVSGDPPSSSPASKEPDAVASHLQSGPAGSNSRGQASSSHEGRGSQDVLHADPGSRSGREAGVDGHLEDVGRDNCVGPVSRSGKPGFDNCVRGLRHPQEGVGVVQEDIVIAGVEQCRGAIAEDRDSPSGEGHGATRTQRAAPAVQSKPTADGGELQQGSERALAVYEYKIKHAILPALRGCLKPPRGRATDGSCVQIAALERLYRIFERC